MVGQRSVMLATGWPGVLNLATHRTSERFGWAWIIREPGSTANAIADHVGPFECFLLGSVLPLACCEQCTAEPAITSCAEVMSWLLKDTFSALLNNSINKSPSQPYHCVFWTGTPLNVPCGASRLIIF